MVNGIDISHYFAISLYFFGTIAIYLGAKTIYVRTGYKLWLQPIIVCPIILCTILLLSGTTYPQYAQGGDFISFMLTPTTVAFAIPLYKYRTVLQRHGTRLVAIIGLACFVAMGTSIGLAYLAGLGHDLEMSLAPRSVTTPLALSASHVLGGIPTITAALVILTGITGMIMSSLYIQKVKINNYILKGLLYGITAHGTGTAKAFEQDTKTGVIASIAMIFMGIITTIMAPILSIFSL